MAVWQVLGLEVSAKRAVEDARKGYRVRLVTDPATLRDCWHCGRVMEAGPVDEKGRDWCGCKQQRSIT